MKLTIFPSNKILSTIGTFALILAVHLNVAGQGQGVCGTDEHYQARIRLHPEIVALQHQMDAQIEMQRTGQAKTAQDHGQEIIVPICFHIIHNNGSDDISDEVVKEEVARLNIDYNKQNSDTTRVRDMFKPLIANPHITFQLATVNPWGQCTNGIDRVVSNLTDNASDEVKALDWWDSRHYLNIWVVNNINSIGLPPGEQIAGYSHFPWDATYDPADDGIVVGYSFIGKNERVLTHEIGHYFGLYHPFQDSCSVNQNLQGDHLADTPPVAAANFGWHPGVNSCHTDTPDLPDLIEDYMDYADLPCMFTTDQVWRMRAFAFERGELISQGNLDTVLGNACASSSIHNYEASNVSTVTIFPSPANSMVTIQTETASVQTGGISVVDITGKTIFSQNILFGSGNQEMTFTRQQLHITADGIYFFRIIIGNNVIEKKVVFQN